jgi:Ribonuclease G/E
MALDIVSQVWDIVRDSVHPTDRETVADHIVSMLIDNDYSPAEIKDVFRGDSDFVSALKYYNDQEAEYEEEEYEEELDFDDEDEEWD